MTHHFGLAETWQPDGPRAFETANAALDIRNRRKIDARRLAAIHLEDQRLLEHQPAIAGHGLGFPLRVGGRRRPPAGRIDGHRTTAFSAASKASISSSVTVSVTATTKPFWSVSAPG